MDVRCLALSDKAGSERFCRFAEPRRDGFSGLRQRREFGGTPQWITVRVSRLDDEIGDRPNDVHELAAAMRGVLDRQLRDRLNAAARHELRRYEPTVVAAELQRLYAAVTSRGPSRLR